MLHTLVFVDLLWAAPALSAATTYTYATCSTRFGTKSKTPVPSSTFALTYTWTAYQKIVVTPTRTITPPISTQTKSTTISSTTTSTVLSIPTIITVETISSTLYTTTTNLGTTSVVATTSTATAPTLIIPASATLVPVQSAFPGLTYLEPPPPARRRNEVRRKFDTLLERAETGANAIEKRTPRHNVQCGDNGYNPQQYPQSVGCKRGVLVITTETSTSTAKTTVTKTAPTPVTTITFSTTTTVTSTTNILALPITLTVSTTQTISTASTTSIDVTQLQRLRKHLQLRLCMRLVWFRTRPTRTMASRYGPSTLTVTWLFRLERMGLLRIMTAVLCVSFSPDALPDFSPGPTDDVSLIHGLTTLVQILLLPFRLRLEMEMQTPYSTGTAGSTLPLISILRRRKLQVGSIVPSEFQFCRVFPSRAPSVTSPCSFLVLLGILERKQGAHITKRTFFFLWIANPNPSWRFST
ncbi:hypothetical protein K402DRAFT_189934 [Aulographum hederae CBS 113979]|uniref:Uncharacterized protein n=1 Tax=Aulographum hederae CBS 113979 TaxID=1176131 RepID=A0A6G1GPT5_9PEZI|nr:hypothetical protein K402DRAFT_189934 [Aulographum hederae CBS 113979]